MCKYCILSRKCADTACLSQHFFKYGIFIAKMCKYGIFVAKMYKYGIFVAKMYKYGIFVVKSLKRTLYASTEGYFGGLR